MQMTGNTAGIQERGASFYPDEIKILFLFLLVAENVCCGDYKNTSKRVVWQVLTYNAYYTSMRDHLQISDQYV